jgi:hypothetical protein
LDLLLDKNLGPMDSGKLKIVELLKYSIIVTV